MYFSPYDGGGFFFDPITAVYCVKQYLLILMNSILEKAKTSCENRTPALRKTPRNRKKPIIEFDSDDEDLFDQDWGEDEIDESV